ncbi:hypothetical protein BC940DRAFT_181029 [Gongronella butleri]|nr:hypothetical protein BC940DRAFT_181029 [Gongronella butleri]
MLRVPAASVCQHILSIPMSTRFPCRLHDPKSNEKRRKKAIGDARARLISFFLQMTPYLPPRTLRRLGKLQDLLAGKKKSVSPPPAVSSAMLPNNWIHAATGNLFTSDTASEVVHEDNREQWQEELDDIVAGECVLCGDVMIKSVDQPFVSDEEVEVMHDWAV